MSLENKEISGHFCPPAKKIALIASRFNENVVDRLVKGAKDILIRHGMKEENIECFWVPGAFEIPLACQRAAETNRFSGILSLGAVIKGATSHFDFVASACTTGIMQVQLKTNVPISFGVLTTDTLEQAMERAGSKVGNKGAEYALSLLETIDLLGKIND